nr:type II toxin-antitoxin system VapC family toxin [Candidatus Njordarchaeota archaeon]
MRFLDANVFIYAYYKPKQTLSEQQREFKEKAKKVVRRINEGEEVITSVIHLSEISNILKRALSINDLHLLMIGLYSLGNVKVMSVSAEEYLSAVEMMNEHSLDPNDCLAVGIMQREGVDEIYTFDKGFDRVKSIKRLP